MLHPESFCVADGPGCDGIHDDWCRRNLPHRSRDCNDDCRAFRGSGEFKVADENKEG